METADPGNKSGTGGANKGESAGELTSTPAMELGMDHSAFPRAGVDKLCPRDGFARPCERCGAIVEGADVFARPSEPSSLWTLSKISGSGESLVPGDLPMAQSY